MKPVAGNWSKDWDNPLAKCLLNPKLTDNKGELEFSGLKFSTVGNIGDQSANYTLQFRCGLALSPEYNITVTSRIKTITLENFSTSSIVVSRNKTYDCISFLRILDGQNQGVAGKVIDKISVNKLIVYIYVVTLFSEFKRTNKFPGC